MESNKQLAAVLVMALMVMALLYTPSKKKSCTDKCNRQYQIQVCKYGCDHLMDRYNACIQESCGKH